MEDDKIKTSRASQTRSKIESVKVWTPPNSLDAPIVTGKHLIF